jgi:hypothetical protein
MDILKWYGGGVNFKLPTNKRLYHFFSIFFFNVTRFWDSRNYQVIQSLIGRELEIDPTTIPFQNVHRLRKRPDGKPRSIVARFTRFDDHEKVRRAASEKLKNKAHVSVYQQYPMEISVRRKQLLPRFNDAFKNEDRARLLNDKLFINGQLINSQPPPPGPPVEIRFNDRPRPQYHYSFDESTSRPR